MFDTASGWGKKSSPAAWENVPYFSTEAYKFRLGDVNFHQSCRLKAKVYRPMSSLAGRRVADKNWLFCRSLLGKSRLETMELPGVFFLVSSRLSLYFCCQFQVSPREVAGRKTRDFLIQSMLDWPESSSFQRGNG